MREMTLRSAEAFRALGRMARRETFDECRHDAHQSSLLLMSWHPEGSPGDFRLPAHLPTQRVNVAVQGSARGAARALMPIGAGGRWRQAEIASESSDLLGLELSKRSLGCLSLGPGARPLAASAAGGSLSSRVVRVFLV